MRFLTTRRNSAVFISLAGMAAALLWSSPPVNAEPSPGSTNVKEAGDESAELMEALDSYGEPRLSPSGTVQPGAYGAAWQHIKGMPVRSASYKEVTTQPFNSDSLHYRDRSASNSGGGAGYSSGRVAAMAVDPSHPGVVYTGGADGGVFRSSD